MYSSLDDEPQRRKSQRGSVVAGLIFGIACWLMVSIMVNNNEDCQFRFLLKCVTGSINFYWRILQFFLSFLIFPQFPP